MDPPGAWLPTNFRFPASLAAAQVYESMGRREAASRRTMPPRSRSFDATAREQSRRSSERGRAWRWQPRDLAKPREAIRHAERAVELLPVSKDAGRRSFLCLPLAQIQARLGDHAAAFATLDKMFSVPGFTTKTGCSAILVLLHSALTLRFARMSIDGHHREARRS